MKLKSLLVLVLYLAVFKVNAQWDELPLKTTLSYSGFAYKTKVIGYKGRNNIEDTVKKIQLDTLTIKLDTIIRLSGKNRKLIFLSKCIDSIVFNTYRIIVNGRIEDLPKDKNGLLDYSMYAKIPEKDKATILYEVNTEIYALTVPLNYYAQLLINPSLIEGLDSAILHLQTDTGASHQIWDVYVYSTGKSIPIMPFLELNHKIKIDTDFETQFYYYAGLLKPQGNKFLFNATLFNQSTKHSNHSIAISPGYGIVNADHEIIKPDGTSEGIVINLVGIK
jgi:hypothetical protein